MLLTTRLPVLLVAGLLETACHSAAASPAPQDPLTDAARRRQEAFETGSVGGAPKGATAEPIEIPRGDLRTQVATLCAEGRAAKALELVEAALASDASNAGHWRQLSIVQAVMQRPQLSAQATDRALAAAEARLRTSPDANAYEIRAWALSSRGTDEQAVAALEAALKLPSRSNWLRLTELVYRPGRIDPARFAADAERITPRASAAIPDLLERAHIEVSFGMPAESLLTCSAILTTRPSLPLAMALAAGCHAKLGAHERAYDLATRALELGPDCTLAAVERAVALVSLGRSAEAEQLAKRLIAANPDVPLAHFTRALALMSMQRSTESLSAFRYAIELWPEDADYHANLAKLYGQMGLWEQALGACDEALRLNPLLASTHADRAVALGSMGRGREASEAIARGRALEPENPHVLHVQKILSDFGF